MAYPRPTYDPRPSPYEPERSRSSWDNLPRPHYPSMPSPSHHSMPSPSLFDLESESSDVSDNPGSDYQPHAIEIGLRELQRVEDLNIQKRDQLRAKRARKDDRIRRKREAQDAKIKAIMDARARRDERISRRRSAEDEAFDHFDQELEEEENVLRRRQKRLKRGLPVEDLATGSRISSASMSPPGPAYSGIPPPAKRHQPGPPGQNDSPITSTPRPSSHGAPSAPNSAGPNPPPYAFLQSSHAPGPAPGPAPSPYGRSPTISSQSPLMPAGFQPIPRSHQSTEPPPPFGINGHPPSPHSSRPSMTPGGPLLNTAPPPRQPATSYDTRPPPVASGFATINAPPTSGFAPINPRSTATPPAPIGTPLTKNVEHERSNGNQRPYAPDGTPIGGSTPTTTTTITTTSSKRTPSTTHPYQMSEAFANRHHHCERIDHLHRGIWTSHGPGGTKEIPTGPPQEMYLRCNHDGCRRIDWKTVHGLQCHIVKNHEQPKGTIGSLEKALDRYGVPVAEVEAYEREHGDGTGGTMADPKNLKLKTKSRESTERADGQRKHHGQTPHANTNGFKPNVPTPLGHLSQPYLGSPASVRSIPYEEPHDSDTDSRGSPANLASKAPQPTPPRSGFPAVNGSYTTATAPAPAPAPAQRPVEYREHEQKVAPRSVHISDPDGSIKRDVSSWHTRPGNTDTGKPQPPPNTSIPPPGPSPRYPGPTSAPNQPVNGSPFNQNRSVIPPAGPAPTPSSPTHQFPPLSRQDQPPPHVQPTGEPDHAPTPAQPAGQTKSIPTQSERPQDTPMTGVPGLKQESSPTRPGTAASEKQFVAVAEGPKETESAKPDTIEPSRAEPRSPENAVRRTSIIGVRSSRRSSVAAIRAEKEKEREREEAAAAAKAGTEAQTGREKERPERDDDRKQVDGEQEKQADRDGEQYKDDDSDDPDTITAAVPSSLSRDRDREREGRDSRTTPRRQANGRFLRKTR